MSVTAEYGLTFAIEEKQSSPLFVQDLGEIGVVSTYEGKGIISVLGSNILHTPGTMGRIFKALSDFNIYMISFGALQSSINIVVENDDLPDGLNQMHEEFFESVFTDDVFEELDKSNK
jgi:Aspartokinases